MTSLHRQRALSTDAGSSVNEAGSVGANRRLHRPVNPAQWDAQRPGASCREARRLERLGKEGWSTALVGPGALHAGADRAPMAPGLPLKELFFTKK